MKCRDCGTELVCPCCSAPTKAVAKRAAPVAKRGTRIHEDWYPDLHVIDAIKAELPYATREWLTAQHRQFIDYWISVPGQRGIKLDWNATWRNWMRRSSERTPMGHNGTRQPSKVDQSVVDLLAMADRFEQEGQ